MTALDIVKQSTRHIKNIDIQTYTSEQIQSCSDYVNPYHIKKLLKKKECYGNAASMLSYLYSQNIPAVYVEGFVTIFKEFPIEHAWIKILPHQNIETEAIIDPTFELVLDKPIEEIQEETYFEVKSYTHKELYAYIERYERFGPFWNPVMLPRKTYESINESYLDDFDENDIEDVYSDDDDISDADIAYEENLKRKDTNKYPLAMIVEYDIFGTLNLKEFHKSLFKKLYDIVDSLWIYNNELPFMVSDCYFGTREIDIDTEDYSNYKISITVMSYNFRYIKFNKFHLLVNKLLNAFMSLESEYKEVRYRYTVCASPKESITIYKPIMLEQRLGMFYVVSVDKHDDIDVCSLTDGIDIERYGFNNTEKITRYIFNTLKKNANNEDYIVEPMGYDKGDVLVLKFKLYPKDEDSRIHSVCPFMELIHCVCNFNTIENINHFLNIRFDIITDKVYLISLNFSYRVQDYKLNTCELFRSGENFYVQKDGKEYYKFRLLIE